jgi:acetyl-CoA carboxylase biotin carboxylase subunit
MFTSVLIANRGEIALRVVRTCKEMGLRTIVVYSTADKDSAAVQAADEAVHIGPAPAKRSYLSMPAIIEAALRTGAEAIHPGYGFLSEDPDFSEICEAAGITFIGPPANVMAQMGDKALARTLMADAGLPILPGKKRALESAAEAKTTADRIGYPVILKAVAGGGGRGITVVTDPRDVQRSYQESRAAAQSLFGDGRIYIERYLESARHVEVQILCDKYGNAIHLGERDCSVQRRHQKLIEESPAPGLPADLVSQICEAAVLGAKAIGFVGAGTFEFLVGGKADFYFMEINCRIQVEHPVTEMRTGVDLVREQLKVAAGEPLSFQQSDIQLQGTAIECRVNVEDPDRDFAPTPGVLEEFRPPGGPFVRVDTHGYVGYRVPPTYDSLLAKTIVWAPDREQAIARMVRALGEFEISGPGVRTTIGFLRNVLGHPLFASAKHDTAFTDTVLSERTRTDAGDNDD